MPSFKSAALAAIFSFAAATSASALTLDFDTGMATFSDVNVLETYEQGDYTFSFQQFGTGSIGPNLFNTLFCVNNTGGDAKCGLTDDLDLVPLVQGTDGVAGNILIRQESKNGGNQQGALDDDASQGGIITVTLEKGKPFTITSFSGVDEQPIFIDAMGQTCGPVDNPGDRDTGTADCTSSLTNLIGVGESFSVRFIGSGGVDSIALAPVPLPAGLSLLLAGLGSFAFLRRRRAA